MTLTEAVRVPPAVGLKVTVNVQLLPAASVEGDKGQVFVWLKSPELLPVMVMVVMVSALFPLLVKVTFWVALLVPMFWTAKVRLVGEKVTAGPVPVPLRPTVCGLPGALSATLRLAERAPVAVGAKITVIVHLLPAAKDPPQVFVWLKSLAFAPVILMLFRVRVAVPVFVSVTALPELFVPTA